MPTYAKRTEVAPERSRSEIERTLQRYGATGFMYGWSEKGAVIGFMMQKKQYRITLRLPSVEEFQTNAIGAKRPSAQMRSAFDQATRQRYRALALVIKAKLEAVESKISTVETEFLTWMVLPNGQTVGQWMMPQLDDIYARGKMPPLLPGGDDLVEGEQV